MEVLDGQHVDPAGIELVDVVIQLERVAAEDRGLVVQEDDPPGGESVREISAPRVDRVDALSGECGAARMTPPPRDTWSPDTRPPPTR